MATPVLADLRKAFPKAHITAMCRSPLCELLREDPHIDELFCFSKVGIFTRRNDRRDIIGKTSPGQARSRYPAYSILFLPPGYFGRGK